MVLKHGVDREMGATRSTRKQIYIYEQCQIWVRGHHYIYIYHIASVEPLVFCFHGKQTEFMKNRL